MPSYCVQFLADPISEQSPHVLDYFFTHGESLEETAWAATLFSARIPETCGYRVLDMGGFVHMLERLRKDDGAA